MACVGNDNDLREVVDGKKDGARSPACTRASWSITLLPSPIAPELHCAPAALS
jgi:hypothetical protein